MSVLLARVDAAQNYRELVPKVPQRGAVHYPGTDAWPETERVKSCTGSKGCVRFGSRELEGWVGSLNSQG